MLIFVWCILHNYQIQQCNCVQKHTGYLYLSGFPNSQIWSFNFYNLKSFYLSTRLVLVFAHGHILRQCHWQNMNVTMATYFIWPFWNTQPTKDGNGQLKALGIPHPTSSLAKAVPFSLKATKMETRECVLEMVAIQQQCMCVCVCVYVCW